ncbi:hypothetical protein Celal_2360 [Cellulophaga algicola DSM 14237]|uniref:Uncharacterized protein n=1 Tax=Cellulophaga algicola (strain DSM 14237 / IC166 / ACAM 630) TaxID=688270 RepID=E6X7G9_CELAD|nr:hypothetical protein [Cellulophaga algicola]ADV49651.1 hypothetical protein Celal_2360 [Cellulophaga algicola DSM 14237]
MNNSIMFPALYVNHMTGDIGVYIRKKRIAAESFLRDKKHVKTYQKNVVIIDSQGNVYTQIRKKQAGEISLWHSIVYLTKMVYVESVVEDEVGFMSLSELKATIMVIVKNKPKKWLPLGPVNVVQEFLDEAKTYKEVMRVFNAKIK